MIKTLSILFFLLLPIDKNNPILLIDVYNESFQPCYKLAVYESISLLIDKQSGGIIESYNNDVCYLKEKYDYLFYTNDGNTFRHLGIKDNNIIDLDSNEIITVPNEAKSGRGINDVLNGHQFQVVQNAINNGRPAILNNLGHSMVAFAYDNNYVYLMSGWKNEKKISKMAWSDFNGNIFTNYPSAYDLILSDHVCTEGYYSTMTNQYLCAMCN